MDELLKQFAAIIQSDNQTETVDEECNKLKYRQLAESEEVQALVEDWKNYITTYYYTCTKEILEGLGQMYVMDERFKNNMNRFGKGTAELVSEGIIVYCSK